MLCRLLQRGPRPDWCVQKATPAGQLELPETLSAMVPQFEPRLGGGSENEVPGPLRLDDGGPAGMHEGRRAGRLHRPLCAHGHRQQATRGLTTAIPALNEVDDGHENPVALDALEPPSQWFVRDQELVVVEGHYPIRARIGGLMQETRHELLLAKRSVVVEDRDRMSALHAPQNGGRGIG
jgi:hypothetical protein